ncbi:MAG TPA: hypothetical protein VK668_17600 [Mucilaginibacter sp.]|nr:hypothetical protein [Mucilaginibacter sp.]
MNKEIYNLNHVDPCDIGDVLVKIERSFNIRFDNEMLKDVNTFGTLCDVIAKQLDHCHSETCTTQHAFYQLRNAITAATGIDKCSITPHTKLCQIFPRDKRLELIGSIENELGFEMNLLQPKQWIIAIFTLMLMASGVVCCYYSWQVGVAGILASLISLKMAGKMGKEMHVKTIGDLANKISKELARRNMSTVNKSDIEEKVREFFITDLHLEPVLVRRESPFN